VSLAWISVAALVIAVTLSCTTTINVGILSMAMALIVGVYLGGMSPDRVLEGFPTPLLVTLVGVTLLFSIAEVNGTLARVTARAVRLCRGRAGLLPIMFFMIGAVIATIGAGATPASALLAPPAMAVAARAGIPLLQMAVMAGNGALAGTLSPFAPTGIVANGVMARIGLGGVEWQTFGYNAFAHTIVGVGGFLVLGGWKLFVRGSDRGSDSGSDQRSDPRSDPESDPRSDPVRPGGVENHSGREEHGPVDADRDGQLARSGRRHPGRQRHGRLPGLKGAVRRLRAASGSLGVA
jgi:hypothetical protein